MEYIAKYGKALSVGGAILLAVLCGTDAASADIGCPNVLENFDGSVDISCLGSFGTGTLVLHFDARTSEGTLCGNTVPFQSNVIDVSGTGNFSFTSCDVNLGPSHHDDLYDVTLQEVQYNGFFTLSPGNGISPGDFEFTAAASGGDFDAVGTQNADFSFDIGDPLIGQKGSFAPNATGVPEVNSDSAASPVALAVGALLALSGTRRKSARKPE